MKKVKQKMNICIEQNSENSVNLVAVVSTTFGFLSVTICKFLQFSTVLLYLQTHFLSYNTFHHDLVAFTNKVLEKNC